MSDTASSSQPVQPSAVPSPQGGSTSKLTRSTGNGISSPVEDQPTVISNRHPLVASLPSDAGAAVGLTLGGPGQMGQGARLGHFELLEYVGGGGMGQVYRAQDTGLARSVAVKVLSREQASDPETLLRFRNEARSAARLNHPNIAQVYFVGEDDGLPFIAFEFVEGINLRHRVEQNGVLPLAEAIGNTLQVAEALAHTAEHNVVHRDIKPSNVLIVPGGRVKLIDLGLARLRRVEAPGNDLTASGVTLGTFDYISPEQARDPRNADVRSDIYSLGCTLFYMLAGRPPFPEGTALQKLLQHQGDDPPDVRHFRPGLPEEVSRVLRKMMAKDPWRRYQDPAKLIEALHVLAEQVGLRPVGPGQIAWAAPEEPKISWLQRHGPWMAPIAALILIVVLLDVLWSSSAREGNRLPPITSSEGMDATKPEEELLAALPSPEGSRAEGGEPDAEAVPPDPLGQPSEESEAGPPAPQPPSDEVEPSADQPGEALTPGVGPKPARGPTTEKPVGVDEPNPLEAVVANHSGGAGLGPEATEAEVSVAGEGSSGLSPASPADPDAAVLTAAVGTPAVPGTVGPIVPAGPPRTGLLVVDTRGEGDHEFATLGAACGAAVAGDVIELRYNGRQEEKPLALANLEITIRAAEGFQPVVVFQPSETEIDPIQYPRSMFNPTGNRLTLINLGLELNVPRAVPAENWSLFEIGQGDNVKLQACSLTIRNASDQQTAYHQEVSFFRLEAAPGTGAVLPNGTAAAERATIRLEDCIVRGEAVFLRAEDLQPVDLVWNNGLLATTEQLLVATGGEKAPQPYETIQLELTGLTAVVRSGLCRLIRSEFAPHQLTTHVQCDGSLLRGADGAPLVEQLGVVDVDRARQLLVYSGDGNVYEGFTDFWTVRPLNPDTPAQTMAFEAWTGHWGIEPQEGAGPGSVEWVKLPAADRPVHTHTPVDYATRPTATGDPAAAEPVESPPAGFQPGRLPQLPPPEAEATEGGEPAL